MSYSKAIIQHVHFCLMKNIHRLRQERPSTKPGSNKLRVMFSKLLFTLNEINKESNLSINLSKIGCF